MRRRELLRALGAAALGAGLARSAQAPKAGAGAQVATEIMRLKLRHTWTTTMSSSAYRDTLYVRYRKDGLTGVGEGAGIVRYQESALEGQKALEAVRERLESMDPRAFERYMAEVIRRVPGNWAAKSAMDIALMDWTGQRLGQPLCRLFGLDPADAPLSTFSIGIDTPEVTKQKVREAEAYPLLKIKVGLDTDEATVEAVRSVTKKPIRPDANEGWKTKEEAVRKINWLESQGAQFIEQPLPAHMLEEMAWVRKRVHIPVFADEACHHLADIPRLAPYFDGLVIKLDKHGGTLQSLRMLQTARALGMKTLLGCMVSSSVTITAAAHLAPLADYADLDGNLLIGNDPYQGVMMREGRLILPEGPGLGLVPRSA